MAASRREKETAISKRLYYELIAQAGFSRDECETYERHMQVEKWADMLKHLIHKHDDRVSYHLMLGLLCGFKICCITYWSSLECGPNASRCNTEDEHNKIHTPFYFTKPPHIHALCPDCMAEHFKL